MVAPINCETKLRGKHSLPGFCTDNNVRLGRKAELGARVGRPQAGWGPPVIFIAGRPKAALLFWFFGDFRCGALLFMVIHVIYRCKNK